MTNLIMKFNCLLALILVQMCSMGQVLDTTYAFNPSNQNSILLGVAPTNNGLHAIGIKNGDFFSMHTNEVGDTLETLSLPGTVVGYDYHQMYKPLYITGDSSGLLPYAYFWNSANQRTVALDYQMDSMWSMAGLRGSLLYNYLGEGIMLADSHPSFGPMNLTKFDQNGVQVLLSSFPNVSFGDVVEANNGYLVFLNRWTDQELVQLDYNGNQVWSKTMYLHPNCRMFVSDAGPIIATSDYYHNYTGPYHDSKLYRLDSLGNFSDSVSIGLGEVIFDVESAADGLYVLTRENGATIRKYSSALNLQAKGSFSGPNPFQRHPRDMAIHDSLILVVGADTTVSTYTAVPFVLTLPKNALPKVCNAELSIPLPIYTADSAVFDMSNAVGDSITIIWGDGSVTHTSDTLDSLVHVYTQAGSFVIGVYAYGASGCGDTAFYNIFVQCNLQSTYTIQNQIVPLVDTTYVNSCGPDTFGVAINITSNDLSMLNDTLVVSYYGNTGVFSDTVYFTQSGNMLVASIYMMDSIMVSDTGSWHTIFVENTNIPNCFPGLDFWVIENVQNCPCNANITALTPTLNFGDTSMVDVTGTFGDSLVYIDWDDGAQSLPQNDMGHHIHPVPISYNVCVYAYDSFGCADTACTIITVLSDSVWPGDANSDGIANIWDVLPIGVAYGTSGPVRPSATTNWIGQYAADFGQSLASGVDYKHSDCDGNGNINIGDFGAILLNYGQTHTKGFESPFVMTNPSLSVNLNVDTTQVGSVVTAMINLGDAIIPADSVYGVAFQMNYDPALVDSVQMNVDYSNSWLGDITNNSDFIGIDTTLISFGHLDVGMTRTNQGNKSGHGEICAVEIFTTDDLIGKQTTYEALKLSLSNVKIISYDQTELVVNTVSDSVILYQNGPVGIKRIGNSSISIYPNPFNESVNIKGDFDVCNMLLSNSLGQIVMRKNIQSNATLNLSELDKGVYFMQLEGSTFRVSKRIIKN
ncbi:MAG: T9SS type A sorting domain-containing protein [Flavobacteriales bacterium]|nr:T9SS type A sorting domain-containing protein [Flavobacteriales bacterium]